jgi:hypothetical protein
LGFVNGQNVFKTFEFEHERIFGDEIDTIPAIKMNAFIFDGQRDLALESDTPQVEFMA